MYHSQFGGATKCSLGITPHPDPPPQGGREMKAPLPARGREMKALLPVRGREMTAPLLPMERERLSSPRGGRMPSGRPRPPEIRETCPRSLPGEVVLGRAQVCPP